jgi:aspartyl-tRNA(Asn)/glutamyl-tRNA(Gln) amidotransferase subunit A
MGDRPSSRREFVTTAVAGATGAFVPRSAGGRGPSDLGFQADAQASHLTGLTLTQASELLRTRKVSPVELTEACLRRIEALNPKLNAFITVTAEQALAQAREAEADLQRGRGKGPLHGIPLALKDLVDTAGVRTTAASGLFKDRVPTHDAEVVRRLRAAGAVLLGKLNMHELAYGGSSVISYFGPVPNPWAPDYSSGGSSSGSAVAVAAGLCYGALGSDTGGSIRQPAAYCGIVGLKPTYGRVSTRGVVPLSWSLDHVGPMTRTVQDAALLLQVMAGYDREDTASTDTAVGDYAEALAGKTSSLRIGVVRAHFYEGLHPDLQEAMDAGLSVLRQLTSSPREVETPAANDATVLRAEAYSYHRESAAKTPELFQPETLRRIRGGAEIDTVAYVNARRQLDQLRRSAPRIFDTVDLLITPTTPVPPFSISELLANPNDLRAKEIVTLRNTRPFNMLGLPTISVPCGFTQAGLPIGMQITGPPGGEATVLRLAHAYEEATDWHTRQPALDS